MKKTVLAGLLALLFVCPAWGQSVKVGFGVFGGLNLPIIQTDQGNGTTFGVMARVKLLPVITLEPNIMLGKWGKPGPVDGVSLGIDGSKITAFGIDATLGNDPGKVGIRPFFVAGIASYKIKNDNTGYDETNLGWSGGLGLALAVSPQFDLDVRGKFIVAPQDQGSKKAVTLTGGINFYPGIH